jgi:predicted glycoside hydrolase/deacetylase ChbG (UPF0249 family)
LKRLVVTADDVGLDPGMTAGAIEAHRNGIATACSIVANGRAFDDAVARLRDTPSLEVGVHLTLVEERSLTTGEAMPPNWMRFLVSKVGDVEGELRLQIERVLASGLRVTHLNGHQHLHMLFLPLVRQLAVEYRIPYVRVVHDRGGPLGFRRAIFAMLGRKRGRTIGVVEAGRLTANRIIALLDHVDGTTELVTHPGIAVKGYAHWRYAWDEETRALCDPRVREAVEKKGIALVGPSTG